MTGVGGCGISTQLSTSSGSGHNSSEAESSEHYDCLRNSEARGYSNVPSLAAGDKPAVSCETNLPPPVCKVSAQRESSGYLTPNY